jgi:hypothetical protein
MLFLLLPQQEAHSATLGHVINSILNLFQGSQLTDEEIRVGLKEALKVGIDNAIKTVSQRDGYYKNPQIKIPLPDLAKQAEDILRAAGFGHQVDTFEMSMNRAAEQAAPHALNLFWDAIQQITFEDAKQILHGNDDEATLYFKDKTYKQLQSLFRPLVHNAMDQVDVTRHFQSINNMIRNMPSLKDMTLELDSYVTDHALYGLFLMLAQEEKKIRNDPAARITESLKKVFGS